MSRRARLAVQRMEDRSLPATFGVAWPDANHLTLSFAPDGTAISGRSSNLFSALDAQTPRSVWQSQLLRAVETWAAAANVSVGVVTDGGQAFGVAGMGQGDSRFGDIRIGAEAMSQEALAVSVPHDPYLAGTWSGDVLLNTSYTFTQTRAGLFSVALHEVGHVLGLPESTDPESAMYGEGIVSHSGLSDGDIAAIQALYGPRLPDANEGARGNETTATATRLNASDGAIPALTFGDITTNRDVDYYAIKPPTGYSGSMTFRLQSAGISSLAPKLTVLDSTGRVVGSASSVNPLGDTISVTLNAVSAPRTYYLRVEGATTDAFGIGRYSVAAIANGRSTTSSSAIDRVMRGPYENLSQSDLGPLLISQTSEPHEYHDAQFDAPGACDLVAAQAGVTTTHYAATANLRTATEVDEYHFRADFRGGAVNVMTATVASLDTKGAVPRIQLLDGMDRPVATKVLLNGNGTYTVQATGLTPGTVYELRVSGGMSTYGLTIDLGGRVAAVDDYTSGQLPAATAAVPKPATTQTLYIAKPLLFQFILSATATGSGTGGVVRMTIVNEAGNIVLTVATRAGESSTGPAVLLVPGAYTVRFSSEGGANSPPMTFGVQGELLSDPIGPAKSDTTLSPRYINPGDPKSYLYPGGVLSYLPFLWVKLLGI